MRYLKHRGELGLRLSVWNVERAMFGKPHPIRGCNERSWGIIRQGAEMSSAWRNVSFDDPKVDVLDAAYPGRALADRVQHRLDIRGRAADDAQDLGGSRLVLQRLAEGGVSLHKLMEQPHVLDGDHRLVRERLQQGNLIACEGVDLSAVHRDRTDRSSLAEERRGSKASPYPVDAVPAEREKLR